MLFFSATYLCSLGTLDKLEKPARTPPLPPHFRDSGLPARVCFYVYGLIFAPFIAELHLVTRKTRSGVQFSPFLFENPIRCEVTVEDLLKLRFAEQDTGMEGNGSDNELECPEALAEHPVR